MPRDSSQPVFGIVPAAGRSRRMGTAKQLLPIQGVAMLESVVRTLCASAVDRVVVVTHSAVAKEFAWAELPKVEPVINDDPSTQMIDSIRMAIGVLCEGTSQPFDGGVLVCPADQPGLTPAEIDRCMECYRAAPCNIVVATHGGRRGHPIVFPMNLVPVIRSSVCDEGLRGLLHARAELITTVEIDNPAIVRNINTLEEYRRLVAE